MKRTMSLLLVSAFALTVSAGEFTASGKLTLLGGKTADQGVILYKKSWLRKAEPMEATVNEDGTFEVELPERDQYVLTFAHPNYQAKRVTVFPGSHDNLQFEVVLDRINSSPDGTYKFLPIEGEFDMKKAVDMEEVDGKFVYEGPADKPVRYQILAKNFTFNGPDKAIDFDSHGDFISEVHPVDGKIKVVFDPATLRTGPSKEKVVSIKNFAWQAEIAEFNQALAANTPAFREFMSKKDDTTLAALKPLLDTADAILARKHNEFDQSIIALRINNMLRDLDDKYQPDNSQIAALLTTANPKLGSYPGILIQSYIAELNKTSPEAAIEAGEKYLAMEPIDASAITVLGVLAGITKGTDKSLAFEDRLIADYEDSFFASWYKMNRAKRKLLGKPAPALSLTASTGETKSLEDFRGKYVLMDFWATWCGPCIREFPHQAKTYAGLDHQKIEFVGICLDAEGEALQKFMKKHKLTWTQLSSMGNTKSDAAKAYGVKTLPSLFLIGPEGNVLAEGSDLRGDNLQKTLDKYLNQM